MRSVKSYSVASWSALSFFLLLTAFSVGPVMAAQDAFICPADRLNSNGNICTASDVSLAAAAVAVSQAGLICTPGDLIDVAITGTVNLRKGNRYDIGVWVARDGKPMDLRGGTNGAPDEGGAQSCEVVPLPYQMIPIDSDPSIFVIDSYDSAATPQDCYDTKAASNGDVSSGFALTSDRDTIVNGQIDVNNDGVIDASDTTTVLKIFGVHAISGGVDIDDNGSITTADDGVWNGYAVQDGVIDVDGDGVYGATDGTDDSAQNYNDLVTMLCVTGPTGKLALETLVSWHVPSDAALVCNPTDPDSYTVVNSSKCSVSSSEVLVDIVGKLTILKFAAPDDSSNFEFTFTNDSPPLADQDPNDAIPDISPTSPFTLQHLGSDEIFAEIGTGPATIVISETNLPTGWDLADLSCTGDDMVATTIDLATKTATVTLQYNDANPANSQANVICTFNNKTLPTLKIVKNTAGGNDTFPFTGNNGIGGFSLDTTIGNGTDSTTPFTNLQPGIDYSITEAIPSGWSLASASCGNFSGTANTTTGVLSGISLSLGENVTCTFNDTAAGISTFTKLTVGGDGSFDFSSTDLPGGDFSLSTSGGSSPPTPFTLPAGQYVIVEDVKPGWELTAMECTETGGIEDSTTDVPTRTITLNVQSGEIINCLVTNAAHSTLQIQKQTLPDGDSASFTFTGTVNGSVADNGILSFTGPSSAGAFTSDESTLTGWDLTSINCSSPPNSSVLIGGTAGFVAGDTDIAATIAPGETMLCTYGNTKRAKITITKHLTALGPGVQDFGFTSNLPGNANFTLSPTDVATDDSLVLTDVVPATYTVSENDPTGIGWALVNTICKDGSDVSAINLDPGEDLVCTFNNSPFGSATVIKNTVGGDGVFSFTGDPPIGAFNLDTSVGPGSDSVDFTNILPAGIYDVVEGAPPTGWALTAVDCVDEPGGSANSGGDLGTATGTINVDLDELVTCTFENTADGTLIIEKQTLPDGDLTTFTFSGDVAGLIADGGQLSTTGQPGTYTSTEALEVGYALTDITCKDAINSTVSIGGTPAFVGGDTDVSVKLAAGEKVTCTFTNTKEGRLTIIKNAVGANGKFSFNHDVPSVTSPFVIDTAVNDTNIVSTTLLPDTYMVSEVLPPGWALTNITCEPTTDSTITIGGSGSFDPGDNAITVDLLSGEDIICTFTNLKDDPSILLVKTGTLKDDDLIPGVSAGDTISYDFTVTNTGNVALTNVTLTDIVPGVSIIGGPIALFPAGAVDSTTFTGSYTLTQADVDAGTFSNTATATGTPPSGPPVTYPNGDTQTLARNPVLTLLKAADPSTYSAVGEVISYSYELTNDGNVTLYPPYAVSDDKATVSCPGTPATLAPLAMVPCSASYTITQADLDGGTVTNRATGSAQDAASDGNPVPSNEATATVTANVTQTLTLVKTASPATYSAVGEVISYSYEMTNNGNVLLYPPYAVSDDKATVTCPGTPATLAPSGMVTCSASYTITQADLDGGTVTNRATGSAQDAASDGNPVPSNEATATVDVVRVELIKFVKESAVRQPGGAYLVEYTITATNTGGGPGMYDLLDAFTPGVGITLDSATAAYLPGTENSQTGTLGTYPTFVTDEALAEGLDESWTVTATFLVDLTLVTAEGSDCDPTNVVGENTGFTNGVTGSSTDTDDTNNTACTEFNPPAISLDKSSDLPTYSIVGEVLNYSYLITNLGPDVLDPGVPSVVDDQETVTCPAPVPLPIGGTVTCTASRTITQADLDAGSLTNRATATVDDVVSNEDSLTVNAVNLQPEIPVPTLDWRGLLVLLLLMLATGWYFRPADMRRF